MCSETKETGTTTRFFTPDAPNSTKVSSVYGLRGSVEGNREIVADNCMDFICLMSCDRSRVVCPSLSSRVSRIMCEIAMQCETYWKACHRHTRLLTSATELDQHDSGKINETERGPRCRPRYLLIL